MKEHDVETGEHEFGNKCIDSFIDKELLAACVFHSEHELLPKGSFPNWITVEEVRQTFLAADSASVRHWLDRLVTIVGHELWNAVFDDGRARLGGKDDKLREQRAGEALEKFKSKWR